MLMKLTTGGGRVSKISQKSVTFYWNGLYLLDCSHFAFLKPKENRKMLFLSSCNLLSNLNGDTFKLSRREGSGVWKFDPKSQYDTKLIRYLHFKLTVTLCFLEYVLLNRYLNFSFYILCHFENTKRKGKQHVAIRLHV